MSFILDALKKSESDRQRQNGPALYEVKVAAPRSPLPYWAIGLAVLLGVNLIIVAWALLRRPSHTQGLEPPALATANAPSQPAPASVTTLSPAGGVVPNSSAVTPTPTGATPTASGAPASATPGTAPPAQIQSLAAIQTPPAGQGSGVSPGAAIPQVPGAGGTPGAAPPPGVANGAASKAAAQGSEDNSAQPANPDDYAPATEPGASSNVGFHVRRATESGVPLYSQAATSPGSGIPELRLDLHAYAAKPEDRFVLINMKRLREGDSLPEGIKVESITPDGVILSHNGSKFLLPRD